MALKKNYQSGTKYNYASISNIHYVKDRYLMFDVQLFERDSVVLSQNEYDTLTEDVKYMYIPVGSNYELEWRIITNTQHTVSLEKSNIDNTFTISYLNEINHNMVKSCYDWLKANIDMFNGNEWEDC
jgi:hypothetical protein